MEIYRVSFIGHREIPHSREVEERLDELIRELVRTKEYVEFLSGATVILTFLRHRQ